MKIVMFYHSLVSDWNHGNAHFLRGVATELRARGHDVQIWEPRNAWSVQNMIADNGVGTVREFHAAYPLLKARRYSPASLDLGVLDDAQMVIVHEWNEPALVERIGRHKANQAGYALFFHDTHHRMLTDREAMNRYNLEHYDGVLAYGRVLQEMYEAQCAALKAWTWHEAADIRVFHPLPGQKPEGDIVWIGNWGDDERAAELREFLIEPSRDLSLATKVFGVRYPEEARTALRQAGIQYAGWLPNFKAPDVFARYKVTVHVPRRPYTRALPGIPTIRPFEALACGIPLICSPWHDVENLFSPGNDYLVARNGNEMRHHLNSVLNDSALARDLAAHGLATIRKRHTCAHRVDELLGIYEEVRGRRKNRLQADRSRPAAVTHN